MNLIEEGWQIYAKIFTPPEMEMSEAKRAFYMGVVTALQAIDADSNDVRVRAVENAVAEYLKTLPHQESGR